MDPVAAANLATKRVEMQRHDGYMERAIELAGEAARLGEVPVGALVVIEDQIIGEGFNGRERDQDPTAHAEIVAIRRAAEAMGSWRLCGASLYVTLEPCPMCAGALVNARISKLIYGCADPKAGAIRSLYTIGDDPRLNHRIEITRDVLQQRCSQILSQFFSALRASKTQA